MFIRKLRKMITNQTNSISSSPDWSNYRVVRKAGQNILKKTKVPLLKNRKVLINKKSPVTGDFFNTMHLVSNKSKIDYFFTRIFLVMSPPSVITFTM